jgi:hypothetical protein
VPILFRSIKNQKRNVGHDVAGMKRAALWRETIDLQAEDR